MKVNTVYNSKEMKIGFTIVAYTNIPRLESGVMLVLTRYQVSKEKTPLRKRIPQTTTE